jgi:HEAT repeat protein
MRRIAAILAVAASALCGYACQKPESPANVAALVEDLKSTDEEKSGKANLALIRVGEPAVPAVLELLQSGDPHLRSLALLNFWGMGEKAKAAVPALIQALSDPDVEIRNGAALALANMGPAAADAVPALITALGDSDRRVRQTAVKALGGIGPAAAPALPVITKALKRGSWPEAEEAIRRIQGRDEASPSPEPN